MDRFIAQRDLNAEYEYALLKSNMDRFIASTEKICDIKSKF